MVKLGTMQPIMSRLYDASVYDAEELGKHAGKRGAGRVSLRANATTYDKLLKKAKGDTNLSMRRDS